MSSLGRYLANREWRKKVKFNNNWYELKSVFDNNFLNQTNFNQLVKYNNSNELLEAMSFDIDDDINNITLSKNTFDAKLAKIGELQNYLMAKNCNIQQIYKKIFNENRPSGYKFVENGPIEKDYQCFQFNGKCDSSYIKQLLEKCKKAGWTNFVTEYGKENNVSTPWQSPWFILKYSIYNDNEGFDNWLYTSISDKFRKNRALYTELYKHAHDDEYFNKFVQDVFSKINISKKYTIAGYMISPDKGLMIFNYYETGNWTNGTSILFTTGNVNYAAQDDFDKEIKISKEKDQVIKALAEKTIRKFDKSIFKFKELKEDYIYECKFTYYHADKYRIPNAVMNIYNIFKNKNTIFRFHSSFYKAFLPEELNINDDDTLRVFQSYDAKVLFVIVYTQEEVDKGTDEYKEIQSLDLAVHENQYYFCKEKYAYAYVIAHK